MVSPISIPKDATPVYQKFNGARKSIFIIKKKLNCANSTGMNFIPVEFFSETNRDFVGFAVWMSSKKP